MIKQGFIQFDEKNSKIELTLRFNVTETENSHFVHRSVGPFFFGIVRKSLRQRMEHCQNVLTNEILPKPDKVFTEEFIYSNRAGKHFSLIAYKAMEDAYSKLNRFGQTGELAGAYLLSLTPMEALQLLKAIATMDMTDVNPEHHRESIDAVAEALVMAKWNEEIKNK